MSSSLELENVFNKENHIEFEMSLSGRTLKAKLRFNLFRDKLAGGTVSL